MSTRQLAQAGPAKLSFTPVRTGLVQRKCACGNQTIAGGDCPGCARKKDGLQRKLTLGTSNDPLEREADWVADQMMGASAHLKVSGAPLSIQRFSAQPIDRAVNAPTSVDRVLSSPGHPLEPPLRTDMEQRFGYDFSHVRVHSGAPAEQSAQDVGAKAYTVGHNIVFDSGRFAPATDEGRRLIAHELTHVVQQDGTRSTLLKKEADSAPSVSNNSAWDQAFALADESRWEQVAELINGFNPENLRYFIQTYKGQPDKIAQLYLGAIGNQKVGPDSQVARAAKVTYLDFNFAEESRKANWSRAAFFINKFSPDDLRVRLKRLETEKLKALHEGAATNAELGVDSAVAKISAEVLAARSAKGEIKALLLPTVRGEGKEALLRVTRVIDGIKASATVSGGFTMTVDGQPQELTASQADEVRKRTAAVLKDHLRAIENKASSAADGYRGQNDVDRQHWIVAPIVKTLGQVKDPGPDLLSYAFQASRSVKWALEAIEAGNLSHAAELMASGEASAIAAMKMWQAYFQGVIGAGEMTVTVLEITRDAAFISLAIMATIATGGAAAGALGAAEGTAATATAFGVELGVSTATAANVVAVGAPILANVSEATAKVAMGDKVDWGGLVIDTAVQIIIARFGGRVTGGIAKAMLGNPATEKLASRVTEKVVHAAIMHTGSVALTTATQDAYRALRGQAITWQTFLDDVIARLTDPKSLAVIAVSGVVGSAAEAKYGGAKSTPSKADPSISATQQAVTEAPSSKLSGAVEPSATPKASADIGGAEATATTSQRLAHETPPPKAPANEQHLTTPKPEDAGGAVLADKPGIGGATASGVGSEFTFTRHPEPASPEVFTRPSRPAVGAVPPKSAPAKRSVGRTTTSSIDEEPHGAARKATDVAEVFDELTEGTGRGKSSSDTDVIDLPNPQQIRDVEANTSATRLHPRDVWEAPAGAAAKPAETAPQSVRLGWLRDRLQTHVDQAVEKYREQGLTPAQERTLQDAQGLARAFRGSRIDQFAKDSIMQDAELAAVITAPDFVAEPDILHAGLPEWFDITTQASWLDHLLRYQSRYGPGGIRLLAD